MNRAGKILWVVSFFIICWIILPEAGWAADTAGSSGYLSGYDTGSPQPTAVSWWSTLAYLVSLLVIFAFVVGMAYFAAKFVGGRFGKSLAKGGGRVLVQLPVGPKSSVSAIEMAGKVFLVGVTETQVNLLVEITDKEEIEALELASATLPQRLDGTMFTSQLGTLSDFVARFRKK